MNGQATAEFIRLLALHPEMAELLRQLLLSKQAEKEGMGTKPSNAAEG